MLAYMANALESTDRELFIVVNSEIERTQRWLKSGAAAAVPATQPMNDGTIE